MGFRDKGSGFRLGLTCWGPMLLDHLNLVEEP